MKRIMLIGMVLLGILMLVGCEESQEDQKMQKFCQSNGGQYSEYRGEGGIDACCEKEKFSDSHVCKKIDDIIYDSTIKKIEEIEKERPRPKRITELNASCPREMNFNQELAVGEEADIISWLIPRTKIVDCGYNTVTITRTKGTSKLWFLTRKQMDEQLDSVRLYGTRYDQCVIKKQWEECIPEYKGDKIVKMICVPKYKEDTGNCHKQNATIKFTWEDIYEN